MSTVRIRTIKSPAIALPPRKQKAFQEAVDKLFAERLRSTGGTSRSLRKKHTCQK